MKKKVAAEKRALAKAMAGAPKLKDEGEEATFAGSVTLDERLALGAAQAIDLGGEGSSAANEGGAGGAGGEEDEDDDDNDEDDNDEDDGRRKR